MFDFRRTCITLVIGISLFLAGVNGVETKSEENAVRPADENNASHEYLRKRQISPQLSPFLQQDFPSSFVSDHPDRNGPIRQFPDQVTFDEEERFFLTANQQETTLNPLAFINPQRTTTPSPADQQAIDEQRRFQEEIANKGLREQEQRSLGLPQPPTTRPTTTTSTTTPNPFGPFSFQLDSFDSTEPSFEQSTENFFFNDDRAPQTPSRQSVLPQYQPVLPQVPQSHSYSYSRIFRSLDRKTRSIDRQRLSINLLPSTIAPQQFYHNEKRQTTPRNEFGTIGSWLVSHFSHQLQQSIRSLAQTTASPYYPRTVKSPYLTSQNYQRPGYTERPFYTTPNYQPTTPQQWLRYTDSGIRPTSQPWQGHVIPSTELPITSSPRPFYSGTGSREVPSYWNTPQRFQIPQYPQTETEPNVKNEIANYIPSGVLQTTSIPQVASFKPLPAAYMVQPHLPLIPQSISTYSSQLASSTPNSSTDDDSKPLKIKNVQIITTSPVIPFQLDSSTPQNEEALYQAYRQIFAADHPTEAAVQSSTPQSSEENTSVTSLFKSKLNEFKSFHPSQVAALEDAQSKFQQPNQFLNQLQQQPENSNQIRSSTSESSVDPDLISGSGNDAGKTAIFIRVPEEPTSTVGYVFDKALSAKTLQKKENLTGHKKNYRSAQVIKSSLVYRTPPGKRATVSREEQLQNNQLNILEAEKPIKWLLANAIPTTKRPLVNALLNFIQKRSPQ